MIVTLEDAKAQIRVDFDDDDALLTAKIAAAQGHIERLLGYAIETTYGGTEQDPIPDALREAVLQTVSGWYESRMPTSIGDSVTEMPLSVLDIIREYRRWSF